MEVFDVFDLTDYTFLEVERGGVAGTRIVSETLAQGVFKYRAGMNSASDNETRSSDATLHIMPDEPFIESGLVGHGVRVNGDDYDIVGVTGGRNFDDGEVEHYRVTLRAVDFADWSV